MLLTSQSFAKMSLGHGKPLIFSIIISTQVSIYVIAKIYITLLIGKPPLINNNNRNNCKKRKSYQGNERVNLMSSIEHNRYVLVQNEADFSILALKLNHLTTPLLN